MPACHLLTWPLEIVGDKKMTGSVPLKPPLLNIGLLLPFVGDVEPLVRSPSLSWCYQKNNNSGYDKYSFNHLSDRSKSVYVCAGEHFVCIDLGRGAWESH